MDIKLLLVRSITALYLSALTSQSSESLKDLIKQMLIHAKLPEGPAESQLDRTSLNQLRTTLMWMVNQPESQTYGRKELLQRLKMNVGADERVYSAFELGMPEGINSDEDVAESKKTIAQFRKEVKRFIGFEKMRDTLRKASHQVSFRSNEINDLKSFALKVSEDVLNIEVDTDLKNDPAVVADIDFGDPESMDKAYETLEDMLSTEGIIKTPWKAMNRSFGENDGMRRGEFINLLGLPGNYKSGMLLDIFVGAALFNKPFLFDETKKPALVFFSTEDEAPVIMQKIFVILKQQETLLPVDFKQFTRREISEYVSERMRVNGWNIFIRKVRPSMTTYSKIIEMLEEFKAKGNEIALLVGDYFSTISKEGCRTDNKGDEFQDLFRRIREYTAINRMACVTAHQLSTDVKRLARNFPDTWLHMLPGKGYYEGCSKLDTEVDYEAYIAKAETPAGTFLQYLWGKHRKLGSTPQKAKFFCLKYNPEPMHGIRYDMDLAEDLSYTTLAGKSMSEGGGAHFFDISGDL
ncbi:DnaB family ATPase [Pseudomonas aeruginosa]|uniref:DnaB family ATPase n=1 Tax=Pseudomonas aeruginosa TaxID=287 RepID=UPI003D26D13C